MRPPRPPAAGETHVWVVSTALLAPHDAALRSLCDLRAPDREAGRGFLRLLLGGYRDADPQDVGIERRCPACGGPHGPPISGDLRISVSYTPGRVAYALARSAVGIDIELVRANFPWRSVAALVLAPEEIERVHRVAPRDRAVAFLRAWTRREALGKATGAGLLDPCRGVDRSLRARPLELPMPYVASVALTTPRLACHSLTQALPRFLSPAVVL